MIKYCINCEEQFMLGALENSASASDFCSSKCEEEYKASADKNTLELVSAANPDMRLSDIKALENTLTGRWAKPATSHSSNSNDSIPSANDVMNNSGVVSTQPTITDEARAAIDKLLNHNQK